MHMYIRRPDVITSSKEVYENPPGKKLLMIFPVVLQADVLMHYLRAE